MREAVVCDMTLPWIHHYMVDDVTLPRYKRAGINFVSLSVNVPQNSLAATVRHISTVKAHIRLRSDEMVFAGSADDILAAKAAGRLAVGLHFQGTEPLDGAIELVQTYYDLGVRYMLLAYNQKNAVGDGCAERTDDGLSRFGIRLIGEMNRVGVLVDGSHTGYRTTMEAMEVCKAPFIFSHSNAYALVAHYRNIRDDQIRACARSGGLIGINGVNEFLGDAEASTESMFRHIDYMSNMVGPRHLGIGLDYVKDLGAIWKWTLENPELWPTNNGAPAPKPAHAQPEQIADLASCLLAHRYAEEDVRGILGGNFLRVMRAAQTARDKC
jgi:membrane dipeptidase